MHPGMEQGPVQHFNHGSFRWLHVPKDLVTPGLSMALVTIRPGDQWPVHPHPGYEEVIHVVSGQGWHAVNDQRTELGPGVTCHIPPGSLHRIASTGTEDLEYLAVYTAVVSPSIRGLVTVSQGKAPGLVLGETVPMDVLRQIQMRLANATELGVVMADRNGRLLIEPARIPEFCRSRCLGEGARLAPEPVWSAADAAEEGWPRIGQCCQGLKIVTMPIVVDGESVGAIGCGFVLLDEVDNSDLERVAGLVEDTVEGQCLSKSYGELEVVLATRLQAASEAVALIATTVASLAQDTVRERELLAASERLANETRLVADLETALSDIRIRMLEAHLSPHFLFNSLSVIADLIAHDPGRAVEVVYALSDFLRYSLKERRALVPLGRELEFLQYYVAIQRARFGSRLVVELRATPMAKRAQVPFLMLQPLVENAIIHGLGPKGYVGRIEVTARKERGRVRLQVSDDGRGSLHNPGLGFGMRYVQDRLQTAFGNEQRMVFTSCPGQGTTVEIEFPYCEETTEHAEGVDR